MTLLCVGCAKEPSNSVEKLDRLIVPQVKAYTPAQQDQAANEMAAHCNVVPMLCQMINDFGRMRDEARVALGLKVNVLR